MNTRFFFFFNLSLFHQDTWGHEKKVANNRFGDKYFNLGTKEEENYGQNIIK